jgi:hypothetical protein
MKQGATVGRSATWYVARALACVVGLFVVVGVALDIEMAITHRYPDLQGWRWHVFATLAIISVFWFWAWMFSDYFRNRPATHPVAWGWTLFLASFLGALIYFLAVWRPRRARVRT